MENETRNSRIKEMTDAVNEDSSLDRLFADVDLDADTSSYGSAAGTASDGSAGQLSDSMVNQPRSSRVAQSMRSGSSRVKAVDMSSFDSSSSGTSRSSASAGSARSTAVRSSAASRTGSASRMTGTTRTGAASRTTGTSRTGTSARTSGTGRSSVSSSGASRSMSRSSSSAGSSSSSRGTSSVRTGTARTSTSGGRTVAGTSLRSTQSRQLPANREQSMPAERSRKYTDVLEAQRSKKTTSSNGKKNSKKKKGGMSGFAKFLIVYAAILVVAIIVVSIVLTSFLTNYEKNQPTNVAAAVVSDFSDSDSLRSFLETNSDKVNQSTPILNYEEAFVSALADKKISFVEDGANTTSEVTVYKITADNIPVASITLVKGDKGAFGLSSWVLSSVDTSAAFSDVKTYSILVPEGSTVNVNGVQLADSMIVGTGIPEVLETSAQFIAAPPTYTTYNVKVVGDAIEVSGTDSTGAALVLTQTENSFVAGGAATQEFIDSVSDRVEAGLESYALYFIYQSFDLSDYIIEGCEMYATIFGGTFNGETYDKIDPWLYNFEAIEDYEFSEFEVKNYVKYSDDCFTCDVKYKLDMTFTDPSYSDDNQKLDATWVWVKSGDQWYLSSSKTH